MSVTVTLRRDCLASNEFMFDYGCAPNAIHKLCMDHVKQFAGVKLGKGSVISQLK
jgi:hypothetical protein